jgi:hypothetical protein
MRCGTGLVLVPAIGVAILALVIGTAVTVIGRMIRRRRRGDAISMLVAEELARGAHTRGLGNLAIGSWGMVLASASGHAFAALALGIIGAIGVFDCIAARRLLSCLEQAGACAELRHDSLLVATQRRRAWLVISRRALARAEARALPRAND